MTERTKKTIELYRKHQALIEGLGAFPKQFFIKFCYWNKDYKENAVPMFGNEIKDLKGKNAYFEFVDNKLEPEAKKGIFEKRDLWEWLYDPLWKDYLVDSKGSYLIPLSKMKKVTNMQAELPLYTAKLPIQGEVFKDCPDLNRKISDMTVGDLQCLLVSLIKQLKDE